MVIIGCLVMGEFKLYDVEGGDRPTDLMTNTSKRLIVTA